VKTGSVAGVETGTASCFAPLAADRLRRQPFARPTSPLKTRVRGFCRSASGRFSSRRRRNRAIATGCGVRGYKTASGRSKWPNRDPIGDLGFGTVTRLFVRDDYLNPYMFARNDGIDDVDLLGLQPTGAGPWGPPVGPIPPGPSTGCQMCREAGDPVGSHQWVECGGNSYGYYPVGGIWHSPGQILSPDPHSNDPGKSCKPINFPPCSSGCNSQKFQQCMANAAKQPPGTYCVATHNCRSWSNDAVNQCMKQAGCQ